jgi:polyisoprenyl-phosphate glycosyltransferase
VRELEVGGEMKKISIVIPVYNSANTLADLFFQISNQLSDVKHEIIYVNDNSIDNSWEEIKKISIENKNVISLNLAKNFGQDCAIMAGLHNVSGEYVIIMDDDLQHNPSDIIRLKLVIIRNDVDVCYARFDKKQQTLIKNIGSWLNDKVANIVIRKPKDIYLSPFKILKLSLVKKIIQYDGPYPYIDGLIFRYTSNVTSINVEHHKRLSGLGNYSISKSISVWLRVLTNFSIIPLRLSTIFGMCSAVLGFFLGIYYIILHFLGVVEPEGWRSLFVSILFIGGIQLMALGIIGEYVGRSFLYQSREPQFIIKEIIKSH